MIKEKLQWLWNRILRHGRSHLNTEKEAIYRLIDRGFEDARLELIEHKDDLKIPKEAIDVIIPVVKEYVKNKLEVFLSGEKHSNQD